MYCSKCGKKFSNRYKFCNVCGQPLQLNSLYHNIQSWSKQKRRTIVILVSALATIILLFITALVVIHKVPNGQLASLLHLGGDNSQKAGDIEKDESGTSSEVTNGLVLTKDTKYDIDGSILSTTESYQATDYAYKILEDTMEEVIGEFWMGMYSYDQWTMEEGESIFIKPDIFGWPQSITQVNLGGLARPLSYVCHTMQGELLSEVYYLGSLELDKEKSKYSSDLTVLHEVSCIGGFFDTSKDGGPLHRFYADFYMGAEYSNALRQDGAEDEAIDEAYKGLITGIWPMVDQAIEGILIKYQDSYPIVDRYDETTAESGSFTKLVIKYGDNSSEEIFEISTDGQLIEYVYSNDGAVNRFEHYSYDQFRRVTRVDFYRLDSYGIYKGCKFVDSSNYRLPYYTFEYDKSGHMIHQVAHMSSGAKFDILCLDNKYDKNGLLIETTYYDKIYYNHGDKIVCRWNYDKDSVLLSESYTVDEALIPAGETGENARIIEYQPGQITEYRSSHLDFSDSRLFSITSLNSMINGDVLVNKTFYDNGFTTDYESTLYDKDGNVIYAIGQRFNNPAYAHLVLTHDENMNITSITEFDSHGIQTRYIEFIY